jgi:hypothetical protein
MVQQVTLIGSREDLLLPHKKRRTVSLNPHRISEIEALLEDYV